ncbi:MAG: hypothetical protein AAF539_02460, partial [Planctomycetota bacterium]
AKFHSVMVRELMSRSADDPGRDITAERIASWIQQSHDRGLTAVIQHDDVVVPQRQFFIDVARMLCEMFPAYRVDFEWVARHAFRGWWQSLRRYRWPLPPNSSLSMVHLISRVRPNTLTLAVSPHHVELPGWVDVRRWSVVTSPQMKWSHQADAFESFAPLEHQRRIERLGPAGLE